MPPKTEATLRCIFCGSKDDERIMLHCFPSNILKRQRWIEALGVENKSTSFYKNKKICSRHFSPQSYTYPGSRKLNSGAIPNDLHSITPDESFDNPLPCVSTICRPLSVASSSKRLPSLFRKTNNKSSPIQRKHIYLLENKEKHIRKLKKLCKKNNGDLKNLINNKLESLIDKIFNKIPKSTRIFMLTQLKGIKSVVNEKIWSVEEKLISLSLLKKSPRSYSLLRKFTPLPCPTMLNQQLNKIPFHPGINESLLQHLAENLRTYKKRERTCSLMFDEISIKEHVRYNSSLDLIEGLEDLGNQCRSSRIANHVLVFMVQGVVRKWKQPIAYYFTHGSICASNLVLVIHEVLDALFRFGIPVVAIICDTKAANVSALKIMGTSPSHPFFLHGGHKIFTVFDPPHLLKCTRNLLMKYNVQFPSIIDGRRVSLEADWEQIESFYNRDQNQRPGFQVLYKFTDQHMAAVKQSDMKVLHAAQVLSRIVAVYLNALKPYGMLSPEELGTSTFVMFMNNLFDSFNGGGVEINAPGLYRTLLTPDSMHMKFWDEAYDCIQNWAFVGTRRRPPCQDGWLTSISAMKGVWLHVQQQKGIKQLRPRSFNQDPLKNLLGAIRSGCGNNVNPTVHQFASCLKIEIINGLRHDQLHGTDREEDGLDLLSDLQTFFDVEQIQKTDADNGTTNINTIVNEIYNLVITEDMESISVAYVSGCISQKILANYDCTKCSNILTSDSSLSCNFYIHLKGLSNDLTRLAYPSEKLVIAVGHGMTLIEHLIPNKLHDTKIQKKFAIILSEQMDFAWLDCHLHSNTIKKCIVEVVCCISIPWYCKRLIREMRS